jgi:hemerythrin-like domain-containing protein
MSTFLTATLIPHVDAAERTLYPELERMLQNRHSMAPMRREHTEVRRLAADFARLAAKIDAHQVSIGARLAIRRVLFQLYALLKIHLAEEEAYLRIVEHGVSDDVAEVLAAGLAHPGFQKA